MKAFKAALVSEWKGRSVWVAPMEGSNQKGFLMPAKEIRQRLQDRQFTYFAGKRPDNFMDTGGYAMWANTNIWEGATKQNDEWQMIGFIHDSIHRSTTESANNKYNLGVSPWDARHQDPYNNAARELLGD